MRLAFHIFLKDARRFRCEILLSIVLTLAMGWMNGHQSGLAPRLGHITAAALLQASSIFVCLYLVLRVMQSDSFCETDADWRTRPVPRGALLLGKLYFVLSFLVVPAGAAVWLWLASAGLQPEQHLGQFAFYLLSFAAVLALPCAAVAAITPGLPSAVITLIAAIALVSLGDEVLPRFVEQWSVLIWIPLAAFQAALILGSAVVLWLQAGLHRLTVARWAAGLTVAVCIAVQYLPKYSAAMELQRAVAPRGAADAKVRARVFSQPPGEGWQLPPGSQWLELRLEDLPAQTRARWLRSEVEVAGPTGRQELARWRRWLSRSSTREIYPLPIGVQPTALEGVVYYETLLPTVRRELPFAGSSWFGVGSGRCRYAPERDSEAGVSTLSLFVCQWAFQAPGEMTVAYRVNGAESEPRVLSGTEAGSPFPAEVGSPVRGAAAAFPELGQPVAEGGVWVVEEWKINGFHGKRFRIEGSSIER